MVVDVERKEGSIDWGYWDEGRTGLEIEGVGEEA